MSQADAASSADRASGTMSDGLLLLTWNVRKNRDALELACKHLSRQPGACVAAFQEVPSASAAEIDAWSAGKLKRLTGGSSAEPIEQSHHVVLVGSVGFAVVADPRHELASEQDSERRMQGLTLSSSDGAPTNLQVLGIHGLDRVNYPTERERGDWARQMSATLRSFWVGGPLVILGDLNANPFHDEVTGRDGLHAVRKKDGLGEIKKLSQMKAQSVSLYNPMWHLLPDSQGAARGTYYFPDRKRTELVWHCIDQIIVSEHIEPHILGPPQILTCLSGASAVQLLDSNGVPRGEYSDHLPVQISVDIKKVESCRASAKL